MKATFKKSYSQKSCDFKIRYQNLFSSIYLDFPIVIMIGVLTKIQNRNEVCSNELTVENPSKNVNVSREFVNFLIIVNSG